MKRNFLAWMVAVGMSSGVMSSSMQAALGEDTLIVSPAEVGLSAEKLTAVDVFMQGQVANKRIAGGIVLVARHGKIGHLQAYGQMDVEAGKPMQVDTIVRLYSMSKAITTAAALQLCDLGLLSLDDPVYKYIPGFENVQVATADGLRAPLRPVTVQDLMLHTAGLTYGGDGPDALKEAFARLKPLESKNLAEMGEKFSQIPLAYDPGTNWHYSASIDLLGRVVEVASGEPLDVYLREKFFIPLGMVDTGFHVPKDKLPRFAANYARSAGSLRLVDAAETSQYAKEVTFFSGGGGLVGTAKDYFKFLAMIQNGGELGGVRMLQPQSAKRMVTNQLPPAAFPIHFGNEMRFGTGFGLGFSVRTEITSWDPAGRVGEYGWGGAASTHYWVSPTDDLIVITLEQIMPYQWDTEFGLKPLVYDALVQ